MRAKKSASSATNSQTKVVDREKGPKEVIRKIKAGPISFNIRLTEEQKQAKATILDSVVTVLSGEAGCAKTTVAVNAALDNLIKGHVDKIIITRPTVQIGRDLGFLPGTQEEKLDPYVRPVVETMYKLRSVEEIDKMMEKKVIEVLPLQFVRGLNFERTFIILDEYENCTAHELKALTTRICFESRMVITGDVAQVDLRDHNSSVANVIDSIQGLPGVSMVQLTENFRHPLAIAISKKIDQRIQEDARIKEKNKTEAAQ